MGQSPLKLLNWSVMWIYSKSCSAALWNSKLDTCLLLCSKPLFSWSCSGWYILAVKFENHESAMFRNPWSSHHLADQVSGQDICDLDSSFLNAYMYINTYYYLDVFDMVWVYNSRHFALSEHKENVQDTLLHYLTLWCSLLKVENEAKCGVSDRRWVCVTTGWRCPHSLSRSTWFLILHTYIHTYIHTYTMPDI